MHHPPPPIGRSPGATMTIQPRKEPRRPPATAPPATSTTARPPSSRPSPASTATASPKRRPRHHHRHRLRPARAGDVPPRHRGRAGSRALHQEHARRSDRHRYGPLGVAADDSIMPQTREHLEILRLLGMRDGVIAPHQERPGGRRTLRGGGDGDSRVGGRARSSKRPLSCRRPRTRGPGSRLKEAIADACGS